MVCAICLALLLTVSLLPFGTAVSAEGTTTLYVDVEYGQTEARSMLAMINEFRTDSEGGAWYWNNDDTTKTVFNTEGNPSLEPLVYSYELERTAMLRAAEIAASFDHTRPDGTRCFTAFPDISGKGENIAAGMSSAQRAYTLWREDNDMWQGQGHRRNMLNPGFNAVGIGHAVVGGTHYWVQAFGYVSGAGAETSAFNGSRQVEIVVLNDMLTFVSAGIDPQSCTLEVGDTAELPQPAVRYTVKEMWGIPYIESTPEIEWTSADETVASVSGDIVTGAGIGSTTLSGTADGRDFEFAVTVTPISIAGAQVTLEYTEIEYTGNRFAPAVVSVVLDGKTLDKETDYTVQYSDNLRVGTAKVTVTGKGNYKDTVTTNFTIKECSHVFDEGEITKQASCFEEGKKLYSCTKCDYEKTEPIEMLPHTPGDEADCGNDQTCTVCDEVLVEASGEHADADKDGKCDVCGAAMEKPTSPTTEKTTSPTTGKTTAATTKKTTAKKQETNGSPIMGDENTSGVIMVLFVLMCVSGITMIALLRSVKRSRR